MVLKKHQILLVVAEQLGFSVVLGPGDDDRSPYRELQRRCGESERHGLRVQPDESVQLRRKSNGRVDQL